jgi:hypothetical protein
LVYGPAQELSCEITQGPGSPEQAREDRQRNSAVRATWALLTGEHAAGVPALVNGPAAVLILRLLVATRRKARLYLLPMLGLSWPADR